MARIPINIADHIGRTPMVQLTRIAPDGARDRLADTLAEWVAARAAH